MLTSLLVFAVVFSVILGEPFSLGELQARTAEKGKGQTKGERTD